MTARKTLEQHLMGVPAAIQRSMIEDRANIEPGGAAVLGRFFTVVNERREPEDVPSQHSFRAAAASESTLATLLRTLTRYAPHVSTAAARDIRAEWYARRPRRPSNTGRQNSDAHPLITTWPATWRAMYPALMQARIKDSSKKRYLASISRCAQFVHTGSAKDELNFYNAWCLSQALRANDPDIKPITLSNYLQALIALGKYGGLDPEALDGIRYWRDALKDQARTGEKRKIEPINDLMSKGGFDYIAARIGELRSEAHLLPDHASRKELLLQTAAICAVDMNKPARTGDMASWCFGDDLRRELDGSWHLAWRQEKTGRVTEAGELWPEIGEILDELVLGGRPSRFIHMRYRELLGMNWLTLTECARPSKWPSERIKVTIGVPSHDLRTLAADYMRRYDPENAANVISAHLGHASKEAGVGYSALCEGDAAARGWLKDRKLLAAAGRGRG